MCRGPDPPTPHASPLCPIVYSRDQLLALRTAAKGDKHQIPAEILRKTRRGRRGGRILREKRNSARPVLPSVIMGNTRSLANKADELAALARFEREYRDASLMIFTETWLTEQIPDSTVAVEGFSLIRADRTEESGKKKGGGLAVFVSDRWCKPEHVTVKERICNRDIELLAVSMRPYYLPREFSHAIAIATYVPPSANTSSACEILGTTLAKLQTRHPQALFLTTGDFNQAKPSSVLPTHTQYVTCPTRDNKPLDLFFANIKEAYTASALPPLGRSDHNIVHLRPVYVPLVHRQPVEPRVVRRWTAESEEALRDCFSTTVWSELCDPHGQDINAMTECITDYITFCYESIVPIHTVRCFPNNKPWINRDVKALLKEKKRAFRSGSKQALKEAQKRLRRNIRKAQAAYKERMEQQLQRKNTRGVWNAMKSVSGFKPPKTQTEGDKQRANDLNSHFLRFEATPPHPPTTPPTQPAPTTSHLPPPHTPRETSSAIALTREQVREQLRRLW